MIYEGESNWFTLILSPLFAGITVASYLTDPITDPISESEPYNKFVEYLKDLFKVPIKKIRDKIDNWYPTIEENDIELGENYEISDDLDENKTNKKALVITFLLIFGTIVYFNWDTISPAIVAIYHYFTDDNSRPGGGSGTTAPTNNVPTITNNDPGPSNSNDPGPSNSNEVTPPKYLNDSRKPNTSDLRLPITNPLTI